MNVQSVESAASDFRRARKRAAMRDIVARLTGRPADLLPYEEVRRKLRGHVSGRRELRDIPLDAIVGSVGRYTDFTRDFLPRNNSAGARWAGVKRAVDQLTGVPPIEVYRIGQAYFVLDGNHRVSVARENGASSIQAYVTPVDTRVPLTPDVSPDDLIVKAEYADFLEATRLDELRPDADLSVTAAGQYSRLEQQIEQRRAELARQLGREVALDEAAADWYDATYLPVVQAIREQGIMHDFPGRTEADLYLWIAEHHAALEQALGWKINASQAIDDLATQHSQQPRRVVARLGERLLDAMTPNVLDTGPAPGSWRQGRHASPQADRLISDLLVAISGEAAGWQALDQALFVARREGARLAGLHVVASAEARDSAATQAVRAEFDRRCAAAGVTGSLAVEVGEVARVICDRARWTDLVVVSLSYPPGVEPIARLRSGFRSLIQRCPRPILAVPSANLGVARALLPYDGSPKSEEALFAATYLALRWGLELDVLTVIEGEQIDAAAQERARRYLEEHAVQATYHIRPGPVAETILQTAEEQQSDAIVIGGYGFNPLLEIVLGSAVDQVLRESRRLVLLCR
ncbi:MAG: universal stress protein [Kouleothrix sp.]|nr:universal stress protein [Kouleothrix sp.]